MFGIFSVSRRTKKQMRKLLQINITANWGSHGKIMEGIGNVAIAHGWESYACYGRWMNLSKSHLYHIGNNLDEVIHIANSRLLDNHGLCSRRATRNLTKYIEKIKPDIVHLHNIHGYYLNYPILFDYLSRTNVPIVWTLHDCWAYTGHCAHYMFAGCNKWKSHCHHCPQLHTYPKSQLFDHSYSNFEKKKYYFLKSKNLTLVPVSKWLEGDLRQSFLKDCNIKQIYNGIDCHRFSPIENTEWIRIKYGLSPKSSIVLGVASNWYHKGLDDFIRLRRILSKDIAIVLVGLSKKEISNLPVGIVGIERTQNVEELQALYSAATVFFNPTWEDNFPTTNLEALACGTPVITYDTGGSPEAVGPTTGAVVRKGDVQSARDNIEKMVGNKAAFTEACRIYAISHFSQEERFKEYFDLYQQLLSQVKG